MQCRSVWSIVGHGEHRSDKHNARPRHAGTSFEMDTRMSNNHPASRNGHAVLCIMFRYLADKRREKVRAEMGEGNTNSIPHCVGSSSHIFILQ